MISSQELKTWQQNLTSTTTQKSKTEYWINLSGGQQNPNFQKSLITQDETLSLAAAIEIARTHEQTHEDAFAKLEINQPERKRKIEFQCKVETVTSAMSCSSDFFALFLQRNLMIMETSNQKLWKRVMKPFSQHMVAP